MRLDAYLSTTGLIKRRTLARQLCDAHKVKVNDKTAKPGREIKVGDLIGMNLSRGYQLIEVTDLPARNIRKEERENYYLLREFVPRQKNEDPF
jgi:ribosomal 50S subunit-recycling heat shock protein